MNTPIKLSPIFRITIFVTSIIFFAQPDRTSPTFFKASRSPSLEESSRSSFSVKFLNETPVSKISKDQPFTESSSLNFLDA